MSDPAQRMQAARYNHKATNRVIDHLLKEIAEHPKGSEARVDRIFLVEQLINEQRQLRAVASSASGDLIAEIRPIVTTWPREPAMAELDAIDWDELERQSEARRLELEQVYQRRRQLLDYLMSHLGVRLDAK